MKRPRGGEEARRGPRSILLLLLLLTVTLAAAWWMLLVGDTLSLTDRLPPRRRAPPRSSPPPLSTPVLFHVTNRGRSVEGNLLVSRKNSTVFGDLFVNEKIRNRKRWIPTKRWKLIDNGGYNCSDLDPRNDAYRAIGMACEWCPDDEVDDHGNASSSSSCLVGELTAGGSSDDWGLRMFSTLFSAANRSAFRHLSEASHLAYRLVWIQCDLIANSARSTIPIGKPGYFKIVITAAPPQGVKDLTRELEGLRPRVAPRHLVSPSAPPRDVVCSRALYGAIPPDSPSLISGFVDFYTRVWKFHTVIFYELGLTTPSLTIHLARRAPHLLREGRVVVVDLREEMQALYGMLASDVVLFSTAAAQVLVKSDCMSRARAAGDVRWTFHIDTDEVLSVGRSRGEISTPTWTQLVEELETMRVKEGHGRRTSSSSPLEWISFGSLPVNARRNGHKIRVDQNRRVLDDGTSACEGENWASWAERTARLHREREWPRDDPSAPSPFEGCGQGFEAMNYSGNSICPGFHGRRKVAVRVDVSPAISRSAVLTHALAWCSYLTRTSSPSVYDWGLDADAEFFYLRHAPCLNLKEQSYWWSW